MARAQQGLGSPGEGLSADEFVVMLRHISEASSAVQRQKGGAKGRSVAPSEASEVSAGRLRAVVARLEGAVQATKDLLAAASSLLGLCALRLSLRLVLWHEAAPCHSCGLGRSKHPGEVDRRIVLHWALANMVIQLQGSRREHQSRCQAIKDFTKKQRTSTLLSVRLRRHVDRCRPERVREGNLEALRTSSVDLMVDLLEELRLPPFSAHPFFVNLRNGHPHLVRRLCQEALMPMLKAEGEMVFFAGELCSRMYVIINGRAQYVASVQQQDSTNSGPALVKRVLHGGQWLSEAALWTSWVHRGDLRALTDCLFFALDASVFARVISAHKSAHSFAAAYARKFVEGLNRGLQTDLVEAGPVNQQ